MKSRIPKNVPQGASEDPKPQKKLKHPKTQATTEVTVGAVVPTTGMQTVLPIGDTSIALQVSMRGRTRPLSPQELMRVNQEIQKVLRQKAEQIRLEREAENDQLMNDAIYYTAKEVEFERQVREFFEDDEVRLNECRSALRGMDIILGELRDRVAATMKEISDLGLRHRDVEERIERTKEKLWRLGHDLTSVRAEIVNHSERVERCSGSEREKVTAKLNGFLATEKEMVAKIEDTKERLRKREEELGTIGAAIEAKKAEKEKLEAEIASAEAEVREIKAEMAVLSKKYILTKNFGNGFVVAVFHNFDEREVQSSYARADRWRKVVNRYMLDHGEDYSNFEFATIVKILVYASKLKPGEAEIIYGEGAEYIGEIVDDILHRKVK